MGAVEAILTLCFMGIFILFALCGGIMLVAGGGYYGDQNNKLDRSQDIYRINAVGP